MTIALESMRDAAIEATQNGLDALQENSDKLVDNLKVVGGVADESASKIKSLGETAKAARVSFDDVTSGVNSTAAAFEDISKVGPPALSEIRDAAKSSGDAFQGLQQQIIAARARVDETRKAMDALATSGNGNAEAFRTAQIAWQKAQSDLDALTGKANNAADANRKLEAAFKGLNIAAQEDLDKAAKTAKDNFETIQQAFASGVKPIEDVRRAFKAYADAQRAAVADSDA